MFMFNVTTFGLYEFRKLSHAEFRAEFGVYIPEGLELYGHVTDIVITVNGIKYLIRRVEV